ncbi:hypothetical protein EW146_g1946 [Bondarzewia mesenterica]|uniref:Uncharacterized protein n=1 Tax=Bondarzewia mesenterica TaxID=1095465 RepID=A0A4S4M2A5_9AGAM|nr:hypothetical protein EW146_g1946 [Bondarzewia mesenterica]
MIAGIVGTLGGLMLILVVCVVFTRYRSRRQTTHWRERLLRGRAFARWRDSSDPDIPPAFTGTHRGHSPSMGFFLPIQNPPAREMGSVSLPPVSLPPSIEAILPSSSIESNRAQLNEGPNLQSPPASAGTASPIIADMSRVRSRPTLHTDINDPASISPISQPPASLQSDPKPTSPVDNIDPFLDNSWGSFDEGGFAIDPGPSSA